MGDVVNLRQARKAQRRANAEREASANRLVSGRTKCERQQTAKDRVHADKHLDGHRRDQTR